ncbi:hypothetical protein O9929_18850 [Vibrio lentus]|nr:hypothetical protein [Vibrio lentus]
MKSLRLKNSPAAGSKTQGPGDGTQSTSGRVSPTTSRLLATFSMLAKSNIQSSNTTKTKMASSGDTHCPHQVNSALVVDRHFSLAAAYC